MHIHHDHIAGGAHDHEHTHSHTHEHTLGHGGAEYQRVGNDIEQAVNGVQEYTALGLGDDLRLKCRIGNVVKGGEQIVQDQQHAHPADGKHDGDGNQDDKSIFHQIVGMLLCWL